jgi:prepilin-type N-terminal cleavage/methylation domain-containing protein
MVLFHYIFRRALRRGRAGRAGRGFSLLEIILVLFILGIIAAAAAPSLGEAIARSRVEAEKRMLADLADSITASFESTDLTNLNIAALPGTIGAADTPTEFSTSSMAAYAMTDNASWFAKVARLRGLAPMVGSPPTTAAQPALALVAFNPLGNPRLLFAGPNETGQQRFLLLSLMAPNAELVLPAYDGTQAWFDAIWNNDWESRTAGLPAYWSGRLTPAQLGAWSQGPAGLTQAWRLTVRRIVLPKYVLQVNNNHPTASGFLSYNDTPEIFTALPNSGATTTPEILGGRLVVVNQGTAWPGVEALRFHLHQNDTVILQ